MRGHSASIFLHPFAPRALPRIHATMGALTPARLALRTLIRGNEHRPCSGQVSLFNMTHLSMHSVTNHPARPAIAFKLSTQRDRLPESTLMGCPVYPVWTSPRMSWLVETHGRIVFVIILRTACSPPVALHPASRRRSYLQLPGVDISRRGLSPPRRACSEAHSFRQGF